MPTDSLQTLLQLRRMDVDAARLALIERETALQTAVKAEHQAEAAIISEMKAATELRTDDATVEAFGTWLPYGRRMVACAKAKAEDAQGHVIQARAVLNIARAAAEAVDKLIEVKATKASADMARREQNRLDELSQRGRRNFRARN
jgi:flagellar export protein FliJ